MNLLFFIRLLLRHAILLIVMPFVLAGMLFLLTQDQSKIYSSNAKIYTGIATGSSIVSMETAKFDLFANNAAFDNLINITKLRTTMDEVGMRLLATHLLLEKPVAKIISHKSYRKLLEIVPDEVKALVVNNDFDKTLANFEEYKNKDHTNFIYELLKFEHPDYSNLEISSKLKVRRVQSSDLVEISYESDDPGICKNTLEIFCEVFVFKYTNIKIDQSNAVVKYFQVQIDQATQKLTDAENELLEFNRTNTIINYYEQTKHIASEKEHFDLRYLEIKLMNAGAASTLEVLEKKMTGRNLQRITNERINSLRKELAKVNLDIAMKSFEEQVDSLEEEQVVMDIGELRTKSYELEQQLKKSVKEQYHIENSTEGVPTESILNEWVLKVIEYETSKAQLEIAELQNVEFEKLFKNYAPLGATMKRLERRIDVAEREYLSLLHSLGLAKLKQQNIELNSNLKIVAEPFFPIMANPSKRKYLLVIAFLIGFIIPAFSIIVLEFLDRNIKTTVRAEDFIGLKVASIFPNIARVSRKVDIDFVKKKSLDVIARRLILNADKKEDRNSPEISVVFSSLEAEGKTMLMLLLLSELAKIGYKVLFLTYNDVDEAEGVNVIKYNITNSFHKVKNITDLDDGIKDLKQNEFDYIFVEIPGIRNNPYPISLLKNTDHSFLVTRANRAWTKADSYALKDILEHCNDNEPQILLNGVELLEMENVIGDLPRKRSFVRWKLKNILRFHFFSKNSISKSKNRSKKRKIRLRTPRIFFIILFPIAIVFSLGMFVRNSASKAEAIFEPILPDQASMLPSVHERVTVETHNEEEETNTTYDLKLQLDEPIKVNNAKFYLIGGSFSKIENASNLCEDLKAHGFSPTQIKRGNLHTVVMEVFGSNIEAQSRLVEYLKIDPKSDAWILEENIENQSATQQ